MKRFKGIEQVTGWRRGFQAQGLGHRSPLIAPAPHSAHHRTGNQKKGFACTHSCICPWCQSHAAQARVWDSGAAFPPLPSGSRLGTDCTGSALGS